MTKYEVRYSILPAGTGPDDYEGGDLEKRVEIFELSDPEPTGLIVGENEVAYLPAFPEIEAAIRARLGNGDEGIVHSIQRAQA